MSSIADQRDVNLLYETNQTICQNTGVYMMTIFLRRKLQHDIYNRLANGSAIQVISEPESMRARAKVDLPFSDYTWTIAVPSRMVDPIVELAE